MNKRTKTFSIARATATLALIVLTTATAGATDLTVTYNISYTGSGLMKKAHITRADDASLTTEWSHGAGTLWKKDETHGVDDEYDITFTPNIDLDSHDHIFSTEHNTTFTVTTAAENNYCIKSVVFMDANNVTTGSSTGNNKKTVTVTIPSSKDLVHVTVTLIPLSGTCSYSSEFDNCSWHVSDANGDGTFETLTISGTGRIAAYNNGTAPWYADFHSTITNLVIDNGIKMIQVSDFYGLTAITEVTLPASVYYIAQNAFEGCSSLARVNIQNTDEVVTLFASNAFSGCHSSLVIAVPTPALALQYTDNDGWTNYASKLRANLGSYAFRIDGTTASDVAYQIADADDLRRLANAVNAGNGNATSGQTFRQTADIDLGGTNFPMIGDNTGNWYFRGTYDGQGFAISGLSVSTNHSSTGLLGNIYGATLRGITLVQPTVTTSKPDDGNHPCSVGSIVGYAEHSTIENCHALQPTLSATGTDNGKKRIGAIAGEAINSTSLTNCCYYGGNAAQVIGYNYATLTRVGRARKVTAGAGVIIAAPAATEGFTYGDDNYYREGLTLTFSVNDANKAITALSAGDAAYTLAADKKSATLTVPAADITVTATLKTVSGSCGTSVNWALTDEDGNGSFETLTISGTGAMTEYTTLDNRPWHDDRTAITTVNIGNGVTSIGDWSFDGCKALTSVTIYAPSLTYYGDNAFGSNASGRKIYVFSDCVDTYKSGWSDYASAIEPITLAANEGATGEYWTTYYNDMADAKAPDGTQVFKADLNGTTMTLTPIADGIISRGQGVVMKSTTATVQPLHSATASADGYSDNDLQGTMTRIANPGNAYVLNKKDSHGVGFYRLSDTGHIGAHKAYLTYTAPASAPAREFFGFSETTAIDTITGEAVRPANDAWYTISGVRLQGKPTVSGMYINNGKKVVINPTLTL